jgi:hypothetical protein
MSTLDSSWVMSAGCNSLEAHNSPSWLGLYLAVCKLLDLALALPAQRLPQFQMYKWAFVSEGNGEVVSEVVGDGDDPPHIYVNDNSDTRDVAPEIVKSSTVSGSPPSSSAAAAAHSLAAAGRKKQQDFVPYVVRVARLLLQKVMQCY